MPDEYSIISTPQEGKHVPRFGDFTSVKGSLGIGRIGGRGRRLPVEHASCRRARPGQGIRTNSGAMSPWVMIATALKGVTTDVKHSCHRLA